MTNYERDHLNPPNEKDVEYTMCEYCLGDGWVYEDSYTSEDKRQLTCHVCNGEGEIEINN